MVENLFLQKIKENKHSDFVDFLLKKSSKEDPKSEPYNHEGIDEKEVERLSKQVQAIGTT